MVFTKLEQVHVYMKLSDFLKGYPLLIEHTDSECTPCRVFMFPHANQKSEAMETFIFPLCLATNCLYHSCPVIKKGYYLLEQVVVQQKDHAGMGHL